MAKAGQRLQRGRTLLLRARIALPVGAPPIADAGVLIRGSRIQAIGSWRTLSRRTSHTGRDLGDVILLPGLINAHCHLDYTHMAGLFPPPRHFTDWIKLITTTKQTWSDDEFRDSWAAGAEMLLQTGTTTVGDIEAVPALLPGAWRSTPLRVRSFLEMTGIRSRRDPAKVLSESMAHVRRLPRGRCSAWLSPHAPYSTKPDLMRRAASLSARRRRPMVTHVAESIVEYEMFRHQTGELFRWLARNERDMSDCDGRTPVQHLHRNQSLGPHVLAVHVNYLGRGDAQLLARTRTHVVHCPSSHAYFKHRAFPFHSLSKAGVNICLGTDSLASMRQTRRKPAELSMFSEMRTFAERHPRVSAADILRMATINGARALGLHASVGHLLRGAEADLIAIPYSGNLRQAPRSAVNHVGHVHASMIGGKWAVPPRS